MLTHMESEGVTELDIISQLQEENLNLRKQICVLERLVANGCVHVHNAIHVHTCMVVNFV